jgi:hypothetical protein
MEDLIERIEQFIREAHTLEDIGTVSYQMFLEFNEYLRTIIIQFCKENNFNHYAVYWQKDIVPGLKFKISPDRMGLWYESGTDLTPKDIRTLRTDTRGFNNLFMLQAFLEHLKEIINALDGDILIMQSKEQEISKIFEKVKETLLPFLASCKISQK